MIFPPQGYKNISYKWLNQGMIFRPHGSYSGEMGRNREKGRNRNQGDNKLEMGWDFQSEIAVSENGQSGIAESGVDGVSRMSRVD